MKPLLSHKERFEKFVIKDDHPCIMSKSVIGSNNYNLNSYEGFGSKAAARQILKDIEKYLKDYDFSNNDFFTFIAVFNNNQNYTEIAFEKLLWKQLQHIHDLDDTIWDETVSNNPKTKTFSFSIKGVAFYVVGMHPNSSRNARRSPYPTLVFNLHWQFEKLREMGVYERIRDTIRKRDKEKNGSINPMVLDFGKKSEAAQYSGREVGLDWECPFKHKGK
ncbi:guanitoxin biosynthesis heme-dependent pre-guanitoxin N-hydroxylase GntA [Algibacter mikhailovii]|uniref:guanitoxin biosynthesis heme-dependent pre-guanitoxin N-hydroxylase GntA n=1 Tax=Algibacter mikhailovii TaxID=425498 RepID=UPI002494592B|nr:guanitoxin biosynthesis heme-dependent pre-guanitoxin N-hydroxylase GntA [Algibacter mikhailovii]